VLTNDSKREKSLGEHIVRGSFWMIAARWAIRLTGVVSTIILARLLNPSDFGVVAMAMIVVGMLEVLNQTGQKLAIIRHPAPVREDYDTCWTISILIGLGIALVIVILAPVSQFYFHNPTVVPVMRFLALRSAIGGFENVGALDFRRNFEFDRLFRYNLYPKLISFVVTISLAIALRNYWALVGGMISFAIATIVLSYAMHPYRPRLSLAKIREVWSFSFWTLIRTIGWYLNFQVDLFAIGGVAGAAAMGRYSVATDVASSPSRELNEPMVAVLYPVMAKAQHDLPRLRELYLQVLYWSVIICAATGIGVALIAHDMVHVLLGPKWTGLEPLVVWLALSAGLLGLASGAYTTFDALGIPQLGARMQWLRLLLLCIAVTPVAVITRDLQLVAATRFFVTLIFLPTLFFAVGRTIDVSPADYIRAFWRPFTAAVVMSSGVWAINFIVHIGGVWRLGLDVTAGAGLFVTSLLLLWTLSGQPESPERDILNVARAQLRAVSRLAQGLRYPPIKLARPGIDPDGITSSVGSSEENR
jgi:O-antigen/teichoic acid export membrane protein